MRPLTGIVKGKGDGYVIVKLRSGQSFKVETDIKVSILDRVILLFDYDNHTVTGITTETMMKDDEPCYPVLNQFEQDYDEDEIPACSGGFLFPDE